MEWVNGLLANIRSIIAGVFCVITGAMAIKELMAKKMIQLILFALACGFLGWFALDPESAIATFKGFFANAGAVKK